LGAATIAILKVEDMYESKDTPTDMLAILQGSLNLAAWLKKLAGLANSTADMDRVTALHSEWNALREQLEGRQDFLAALTKFIASDVFRGFQDDYKSVVDGAAACQTEAFQLSLKTAIGDALPFLVDRGEEQPNFTLAHLRKDTLVSIAGAKLEPSAESKAMKWAMDTNDQRLLHVIKQLGTSQRLIASMAAAELLVRKDLVGETGQRPKMSLRRVSAAQVEELKTLRAYRHEWEQCMEYPIPPLGSGMVLGSNALDSLWGPKLTPRIARDAERVLSRFSTSWSEDLKILTTQLAVVKPAVTTDRLEQLLGPANVGIVADSTRDPKKLASLPVLAREIRSQTQTIYKLHADHRGDIIAAETLRNATGAADDAMRVYGRLYCAKVCLEELPNCKGLDSIRAVVKRTRAEVGSNISEELASALDAWASGSGQSPEPGAGEAASAPGGQPAAASAPTPKGAPAQGVRLSLAERAAASRRT